MKYLLKKSKCIKRSKKAEIKNKRLMSNQKQVLSFFNNLFDTIITENNNNNNNNNDDGDEDNSVEENEEENEDDEDKDEEYYKIKQLNDYFKMIDDSKSFID